MPTVSVVIPTRGRPDLVLRAVRSVLAQTVADLEVLVVVDGPDPATVERLAAVEDPRVRFHVNEISQGAGGARRTGVSLTAGDWVAFLDDDDEWLPTKLERQLALAASAGAAPAIAMTLSAFITPTGTSVRPRQAYEPGEAIDEWLFDRRHLFGGEAFLQTSSLLIARKLLAVMPFPDHGQHEDWEFAIRAVKQHGAVLLTVPEVLVRHYAEERRATLTSHGTIDGSLRWIDGMRDVVTPRAYAGFCLTVIAHRIAGPRRAALLWALFIRALRCGRPTPTQLEVFALASLMPQGLRSLLRRARPGRVRPNQPALQINNG